MEASTSALVSPQRRRTQAERREGTRRRILEAVIASIAEVGFQRTTASRIAARAGVTWGAVQHHYGGKDGILGAVLDDGFARFAAHFEDLDDPVAIPLGERTAQFVERAWRHFGSPGFRSTFEILLQMIGRPVSPSGTPGAQQLRMLDSFDRLWRRVFPDASLPRARRLVLESYTLATLMGLALHRALSGGGTRVPHEEIALLAGTIARELEAAAGERARREERRAARPRAPRSSGAPRRRPPRR